MTGAGRQNGPGGKERLTVMAGEVAAVCISEKKGTAKQNVGSCNFIEDWGLEKDAHAGNWHRQVSLLSWEEVEKFRARGANVADGAFGENLLVKGYDFKSCPVGSIFKCNDVVLEITQIGKNAIRNARSSIWWGTASCPERACSPGYCMAAGSMSVIP